MHQPSLTSAIDPSAALRPLAERMRPRVLDDFVGQQRLLAPNTALRRAIESGRVHSMILWGPPGCGKTSLARVLAHYSDAEYVALSAVLTNLAEVRTVLAQAALQFAQGRRTVLFVDEVHRFNKAQQDAFLPHIERGSIVFVGATTENPSFELISALLSRCRVHVMEAVSAEAVVMALQRALRNGVHGLGELHLTVADDTLQSIARAADGDVRRALTLLEIAAELASDGQIDATVLDQVLADRVRRFDKGGDVFYDQISALHKSVRNSNPDAALYWIARMFDGGCDAAYLARRLTRMAVEDIGLADPSALERTIAAWKAFDRLGSPEGDLALASIAVYLAMAPKSNASYVAFKAAQQDVREHGSLPVPIALRNAPTRLMKSLGHGRGYQYDPDVEGGVAYDQQCFPDQLGERTYYQPVDAGIETRIKSRLDEIRALRKSRG
ncbi:MAG: replication-associated recombination protein A [Pseudomonadota bacterium]|nr:replication-associated recombination protein A [Pseudomonadota bacterium]